MILRLRAGPRARAGRPAGLEECERQEVASDRRSAPTKGSRTSLRKDSCSRPRESRAGGKGGEAAEAPGNRRGGLTASTRRFYGETAEGPGVLREQRAGTTASWDWAAAGATGAAGRSGDSAGVLQSE